jgi:hypothetical protein
VLPFVTTADHRPKLLQTSAEPLTVLASRASQLDLFRPATAGAQF